VIDVEAFLAELRALPPAQAVTRAKAVVRNPENHSLLASPAFQTWAVEMDEDGYLNNDNQ
jgi:hypothetical protein